MDGLFEYLAQASDKRAATLDAKLVQRATAGPSLKAKLGLGETTPDETSATHSEWGGGAIIRSAWDRSTVLLAARFDEGGCVDIDLSADRTPWLAGRWTFEATHNGAPLAPEGGWDVVCWLDDAESIYLELEQELKAVGSGVGGRLQRQLLIAKKDRFAVGLDAVFELPVGELEYVSSLPIAPGTTAEVAERSVEILLRRENASSRLLPLPLPEWKRESPNRFWPQVEDGRTTFRLAETGRACCYAWLVDLDVKRAREEFTWRRLTIAEDRRTLARDEAFGARVQIGRKHNWLIYRTLGKSANRTILGKNLTSDFFCGRILKTGLTQVISEVEA